LGAQLSEFSGAAPWATVRAAEETLVAHSAWSILDRAIDREIAAAELLFGLLQLISNSVK
jgi:hypothetical protein